VLAQHKADLITAVPPFSYDPRLLSVARTLFTLKDALGTTDLTVSVARTGFVSQHRAALVDYIEDELRATRWFTDPANHEEAVAIVAQFNKQSPDLIKDWLFTKKDDYHDPNGLPDLDSIQKSLDGEKDLGFLKSSPDVKQYADLSMVREAAARIK
jgi:NitT/TauT family transport system substrate-binding protein